MAGANDRERLKQITENSGGGASADDGCGEASLEGCDYSETRNTVRKPR